MTEKEIIRFFKLRERLFNAIQISLEEDGHCKHYEGTFSIVFPSYFGGDVSIRLDCYVIGPARHYEWTGKTFLECLESAEKDIDGWISWEETVDKVMSENTN